MDTMTVQALALAAGLGLLVGLQREWAGPHLAGIRTFPLLTMLGAAAGRLSNDLGPWVVVATIGGAGLLLAAGYVVRSQEPEHGTGLTTATAALLMTLVGVAAGLGRTGLAVLVGGIVAVLLQWKEPLHGLVARVGARDIHAIMKLALLGLIVLPVLPDREWGPYGVLNPREVWLVVVLICGISLSSYLVYRLLGARAGVVLGGFLGGLISSTAVTIGQARLSRRSETAENAAALVIVIAAAVTLARVVVEVALVAPSILGSIVAPLGLMVAVQAAAAGVLALRHRPSGERPDVPGDPLELRAALLFGSTFVVILLAVAFLKERVGDDALYVVAVLSGLTDVDAITLSTARLVVQDDLDVETGWRMILLGTLANLAFKASAVVVLGSRRTARLVLAAFAPPVAVGGLALAFWP